MRSMASITIAMWLLLGMSASVGAKDAKGLPMTIGPRLIHYPLQCHDGDRCKIDCFQGGRVTFSKAQLGSGDRVTLVFNSVFSEQLRPLWLELAGADGSDRRTILLPTDTLCDFQGMSIEPFQHPSGKP
jgi:hypothetical protein